MGAVQADELPSLSIAQFAADKRAQRAENFKTTLSQDGTSTVAALLTYKDGQQENCTFAMVAEPAEKGGAQGPHRRDGHCAAVFPQLCYASAASSHTTSTNF